MFMGHLTVGFAAKKAWDGVQFRAMAMPVWRSYDCATLAWLDEAGERRCL